MRRSSAKAVRPAQTDPDNVGHSEEVFVDTIQLCEWFAEAARRAVRDAHAEGLTVPARMDGDAVEIWPDGGVAEIDDEAPWSPTDWKMFVFDNTRPEGPRRIALEIAGGITLLLAGRIPEIDEVLTAIRREDP